MSAKTVKELTSLSEIFNHSVFFPIYSHRWSEKRWTFVTHIYFRFLAYLHFICGFLSWFPQFLYFYRRLFSLFEFLVPDKAQDTQATTSTFSHLPSNTHCLPETLHNLCLFLFLLDISPGYYRLPKRMKLIRTPRPPGMGSLRTADAFPVVASLPPKNFRREVGIKRSDDRKCVCCSKARARGTGNSNRKTLQRHLYMSYVPLMCIFTVSSNLW